MVRVQSAKGILGCEAVWDIVSLNEAYLLIPQFIEKMERVIICF